MPIRLLVAEALARKGWTAYRLAKKAGITLTMAYRLADPAHPVKRLDLDTLEKVARALHTPPGKLLTLD